MQRVEMAGAARARFSATASLLRRADGSCRMAHVRAAESAAGAPQSKRAEHAPVLLAPPPATAGGAG